MKFLFFSNEIYSNKLVKTCVEPIPWNSKTVDFLTSGPITFQLRIRDSYLTALLHLIGQEITYPYRVWWLIPGSHFTLKHPACCVEPILWNSKTIELLTLVPIAFQLRIRDSSLTALLHLFGQKITYPYSLMAHTWFPFHFETPVSAITGIIIFEQYIPSDKSTNNLYPCFGFIDVRMSVSDKLQPVKQLWKLSNDKAS